VHPAEFTPPGYFCAGKDRLEKRFSARNVANKLATFRSWPGICAGLSTRSLDVDVRLIFFVFLNIVLSLESLAFAESTEIELNYRLQPNLDLTATTTGEFTTSWSCLDSTYTRLMQPLDSIRPRWG
jgi:hypothetical protein